MARKRKDREVEPAAVSRKQARLSRRDRERRKLILSVTVPLLVLAIGVMVVGAWRELVQIPNTPVAEVEGERIMAGVFSDRVQYGRRLLLNSMSSYMSLLQSNDPSILTQLLGPQRERLPETTLDSLIDEAIIRQEARRRGIEAADADVDQEIYGQMATALAPPPTMLPEAGATASPVAEGTPLPSATPLPTVAPPTIATSEIGRKFDERVQPMLDQLQLSRSAYREIVRQTVYRNKLTEALIAEMPTAEPHVQLAYLLFQSQETANAAAEELAAGSTWEDIVTRYGPTPSPEAVEEAEEAPAAGDSDEAAAETEAPLGETTEEGTEEGVTTGTPGAVEATVEEDLAAAEATADTGAAGDETSEGASTTAEGSPGAEVSPTPDVPPTPTPEPNAYESGQTDWLTQRGLVTEWAVSDQDAGTVLGLEVGATSAALSGGRGFFLAQVLGREASRQISEQEMERRKETVLEDWLKAKRDELTLADAIKRFPLAAFIPAEPLWFSTGWDQLMGQPAAPLPDSGLQVSTVAPPVDGG